MCFQGIYAKYNEREVAPLFCMIMEAGLLRIIRQSGLHSERSITMPNFTKQAIKMSFMKQLNEQPLNKISVRSIVEECGINRNSFYYHFQDIPALIEEILTESADSLVQKYPRIDSIEECIATAFQFLLENKKAILHIFHSVNRDIYEQYLTRCCEYTVETYFDTVFRDRPVSEENHSLLVRFFKYELVGASLDWVSRGMPEEALNEIQHLLSLCHGLSEEIIRRDHSTADGCGG